MKGRPHIILRFSKHIAPPGDEPTSLLSPPTSEPLSSSNTHYRKDRTTSRRSPLSLENNTENMSRSSTKSSRMKKKVEKPHSVEASSHTTKATTTVTTPDGNKEIVGSECISSDEGASRQSYSVSPAPTTTSSIGKRKRDIPKSIGGGKGDLQPPSTQKRSKRRGTSISATSENGTSSSLAPGSIEAKKDEEGRVLRSQDTKKTSEFEEWFEAPEREWSSWLPFAMLHIL